MTKSAVDLKRRFDQQWSICGESKNKIDVWDAVFDAKTKSGVYQYRHKSVQLGCEGEGQQQTQQFLLFPIWIKIVYRNIAAWNFERRNKDS